MVLLDHLTVLVVKLVRTEEGTDEPAWAALVATSVPAPDRVLLWRLTCWRFLIGPEAEA